MNTGSLISYMSQKVKQYGGINLAQGLPSFSPPKELEHILSELVHDSFHQYAPGNGEFELREQIVHHYEGTDLPLNLYELLVTNGATDAISLIYLFILKEVQERFSVMAFDPPYESYRYLPNFHGQNFITQCFERDDSIDMDLFKKNIEGNNVKILFISAFGNPYGRNFPEKELKDILSLCRQKSIYVIFDNVYEHLWFYAPPVIPFEYFYDKVFYVNSFSKMLSITGWRIGFCFVPKTYFKKFSALHDYCSLSSPHLLQKAVGRYLAKYGYGAHYQFEIRQKIKSSYYLFSEGLKILGFHVFPAGGGYFVWARLPEGFENALSFAEELYTQKQIAVVPGENFSISCSQYVRINIAHSLETGEKCLEKISDFILKRE